MTRGLRIFLGSSLLLLLLAAGILWLSADRLLDDVVRPWIVERASAELGGEVHLDRLNYADGRLVLDGLTLNRPEEFLFSVKSVDVRFKWTNLLARHIGEVNVLSPRLTWLAAAGSGKSSGGGPLPSVPPLLIDAWHVEDGRIELHWGDHPLLLEQLQAGGELGSQFPLVISARFGGEPGVPLHLNGQVAWQKGPVLTLDEIAWNDKNLLTQPLVITPDFDLSSGVRMGLEKLDDSDITGLLNALGEPVPWPEGLHWQLTTLDVNFNQKDGQLASHLSTGPGSLQMPGRSWPWQNLDLRVEGSLEQLMLAGTLGLAGSTSLVLNGTWSGQQLNGDWDVSVAEPAGLLQSVGMAMPESAFAPQDFKLHGKIAAAQDKVLVSEVHLAASLGQQGRLEGDVRGTWQDKRLTLNCDRLEMTTRNGRQLAKGSIAVTGNPEELDWQGNWALLVSDGAGLAGVGGVPLADGVPNLQDLSIQGKLQWRTGQLRLPGVTITGRLTGQAVSGSLHGALELKTAPGIDLSILLNALTLESLEYQSTDGMTGLTGGRLEVHGQLDMIGEKLSFKLTGQAGVGEALVQSWYGNLAELPLRFSANGNWLGDRRRLELAGSEFKLADLVKGHCSGSYSPGTISIQASLDVPHLEGPFQKTFQRLTGELLPGIDRLAMEGGLQVGGSFLTDDNHWSLDLLLSPVDVSLNWDRTTRLENLHGHLPIHLRNGLPVTDGTSEPASLAWSGLQASLVKSGAGQLDLQAAQNRWRQVKPLELAVAGGTVTLTSLQLELHELAPRLQASLELNGIELLQVSTALDWPEMGGQLSARLEEVHVSADEIGTVGDASVQAFGGDFAIHNMRVEAPFSRFPTYHADVDFSGVDLYQLTNTFEFGEMNGTVDGYVHELRLFDGTPSAFKAKLETRDEGTRNISVKAIRNLNTLSQGGLSAALSQGIYRFIDFYRYRKIGILCSLQNDLFHLEGTGRSDSNQYLIYGGLLPPRIDVLVSSPTISFKEMVKRLKRIERTER
jgi:translocation and assembly module TamB